MASPPQSIDEPTDFKLIREIWSPQNYYQTTQGLSQCGKHWRILNVILPVVDELGPQTVIDYAKHGDHHFLEQGRVNDLGLAPALGA